MNSCGVEADVDPLQPDEHADAVVDVDDEVADLQIAEVGQERARRGAAPLVDLPLFLEDVGLGPELERGSGRRKPRERWPTRRAPMPCARPRRARSAPRRPRSRRAARRALGAALRVRDEDDVSPRSRPRGSRRPSPRCGRRTPAPADTRCAGRPRRRRARASRARSPASSHAGARRPSRSTQRRRRRGARWPFATRFRRSSRCTARQLLRRAPGLRRARRRSTVGRPCDRT